MQQRKCLTLCLSLLILFWLSVAAWADPTQDLSELVTMEASDATETEILELLDQGADPNLKINGISALVWFASAGELKIVKRLLDKGAQLEAKDELNRTALYAAATVGELEMVDYLLSQGAKLDTRCEYGATALEGAAYYGQSEVVAYLLDKGAPLEPRNRLTPLMWTAGGGHLELVRTLLARGADVKAVTPGGINALMLAVLGGFEYDPDAEDEAGVIVSGNRADKQAIVELLLERGADLHAKTRDGKTVMMYAAHTGNIDLAKFLLAKGADFRAKNIHGSSALTIASDSDYFPFCNFLLDKGARF